MATLAIMVLALAAQDPVQDNTAFAFAHTEHGAMAWNIGRLKRIEGRNAFSIGRLSYFIKIDASSGRPFPFVFENVEIDCDSRRYTSKFRVFFEPRKDTDHREKMYLAANDSDERSDSIRLETAEYSVYSSACLNEAVTGYHIVRMPTVAAMAYLPMFSRNPAGSEVSAGEEIPARPTEGGNLP